MATEIFDLKATLKTDEIRELERAVVEASINKRRCELEAERLEAQRSEANSSAPDFPLLEKIVNVGGAVYEAGLVLDELVDALITAREREAYLARRVNQCSSCHQSHTTKFFNDNPTHRMVTAVLD